MQSRHTLLFYSNGYEETVEAEKSATLVILNMTLCSFHCILE